MRDASGQMYMRNRYYDPQTGQFTQTDPIGLAGGLNAYGFAAGDPVTYSDPYGLCPYDGTDRTADLSDCPDDDRRKAFEKLQADTGPEGQQTIQAFIDNRLTFELTQGTFSCAGTQVTACTTGTHVRVDGTQSVGVVATDLVHEGSHAILRTEDWHEEHMAWSRALNFYGRLGATEQTSAEYSAAAAYRVSNPVGFKLYWWCRTPTPNRC